MTGSHVLVASPLVINRIIACQSTFRWFQAQLRILPGAPKQTKSEDTDHEETDRLNQFQSSLSTPFLGAEATQITAAPGRCFTLPQKVRHRAAPRLTFCTAIPTFFASLDVNVYPWATSASYISAVFRGFSLFFRIATTAGRRVPFPFSAALGAAGPAFFGDKVLRSEVSYECSASLL